MGQALRRFHAVHIPRVPLKARQSVSIGKDKSTNAKENVTNKNFILDADLEDLDLNVARYKPMSLERLQKLTHFTKRELQIMYRGFKQDCPTGMVNEETFREVYTHFFPQGDTCAYAHYIFKSFDPENTGTLTFEQFVQSLSLVSRGSQKEKLAWIFRLYDMNGDGVISKTEMIHMCCAIYDLLGRHTEPLILESTPREHAERIFQKMDLNKDGVISEEEFMSFCSQDVNILHGLGTLDTIL